MIMVGFCGIGVSCLHNDVPAMFYVALFSAIIMGTMQAMGETINLGLMKTFPGDCIGYYSAGTGFGKLFAASSVITL